MKVTFVIPRPLFATDPKPITVEMDQVPRTGDSVVIDDDGAEGQVAAVVWGISTGNEEHIVEVRLR